MITQTETAGRHRAGAHRAPRGGAGLDLLAVAHQAHQARVAASAVRYARVRRLLAGAK
jgi:hypothetical protein